MVLLYPKEIRIKKILLRVGVRAACFGVAAPTLGERAGLDIFLVLFISTLCILQQIAALLNLVIAEVADNALSFTLRGKC